MADPIQFYLTGLLLFFISKGNKINALEALTNIPLLMIFYMTVMAIIQANEYHTAFQPEVKRYETSPLILLKSMGTFVYLFFGPGCFHQVYSTMSYPTTRRVFKRPPSP